MFARLLDLDRSLFLALNFDGGFIMDQIMWFFSSGSAYAVLILFYFLSMKFWKKASWKEMFYIILSLSTIILFADQTTGFLKENILKFRPSHAPDLQGLVHIVNEYRGGKYGVTSAHAANGFGLLIFMMFTLQKQRVCIAILIYTILICYSRIYLGVHYPLDLFFGALIGSVYGFLVWLMYKKINPEDRQ